MRCCSRPWRSCLAHSRSSRWALPPGSRSLSTSTDTSIGTSWCRVWILTRRWSRADPSDRSSSLRGCPRSPGVRGSTSTHSIHTTPGRRVAAVPPVARGGRTCGAARSGDRYRSPPPHGASPGWSPRRPASACFRGPTLCYPGGLPFRGACLRRLLKTPGICRDGSGPRRGMAGKRGPGRCARSANAGPRGAWLLAGQGRHGGACAQRFPRSLGRVAGVTPLLAVIGVEHGANLRGRFGARRSAKPPM